MRNYKYTLLSFFAALSVAFFCISCVNEKHKDAETASETEQTKTDFPYDLSNPIKHNMPQSLFEISGIAFNNGDSKQVYAIQDEYGDLFYLSLDDKEAKSTKFGGKGDYEDLTILKNHFIILKSNGELHIFPQSEIGKPEVANVKKVKDLLPKAEYEGIAADGDKIYVLTKDSKNDDKNKATSIYVFTMADDGSLKADGEFGLPYTEIAKLSGAKKANFKPSALAKNKNTNEWYILSSVNKMIVITDANFKIKNTASLKGGNFNQPEGIAFDKNNTLYISNEGGTLSAGNILEFQLKK
ncbi:SdiA-regulated domain-containing protein [Pedobacter aquatilis]|uniref:SdiA-regulated domain-containing protein n=1 Tax=Pedobacter aquatilis TaxID=351343 RepID=UPI0025B30325|nr:SdiA-regulated domain-containing protein [Pedobacter aquatilis]MDN3588783.1 SdiA-regulated domain-containing protein [Pedobacter aquatilis]